MEMVTLNVPLGLYNMFNFADHFKKLQIFKSESCV